MRHRALLLALALLASLFAVPAQTALAEPAECGDAIDNDNDGATDYPEDGDCNSAQDDSESPPAAGAGRVLDCEPAVSRSYPRGTSTSFTCRVLDVAGQPVPGVDVTFTLTGPGSITSVGTTPAPDNDAPGGQEYRTDQRGRVTVVVGTTAEDSWGASTITGRISGQAAGHASATTECQRVADDPAGAPAGVCEDSVVIPWSSDAASPAQCEDGLDNDDDGSMDFPNDSDCVSRDDDTERLVSDPMPTSLTMRFQRSNSRFAGSVHHRRPRCQRGRAVVVKKVTKSGSRAIWWAASDRQGRWKTQAFPRARGRYFAVLRAEWVAVRGVMINCGSDRSPTIEVSR